MNTGDVVTIDGQQWKVGEFKDHVAPLENLHGGEGGAYATRAITGLFAGLAALPDGVTTANWRTMTMRQHPVAVLAYLIRGGAANIWHVIDGDNAFRDAAMPGPGAKAQFRVLRALHHHRGDAMCGFELAAGWGAGYRYSARVHELRSKGYPIVTVPCPYKKHHHRMHGYQLGGDNAGS